MFSLFSSKSAPAPAAAPALTLQQQVDSLRATNPYARQAKDDPRSWDIGLQLGSGHVLRVRVTMPEGFPAPGVPPVMRILDKPVSHPWLDEDGRIARSPELAAWAPTKQLGVIVHSVMNYFASHPPVYGGAAPAQGGAGAGSRPGGGGPPQAAAASNLPKTATLRLDDVGAPPPGSLQPSPVPKPPASFPSLAALSLEDLAELERDSAARDAFVEENETTRELAVFASSTSEGVRALATTLLATEAEIKEATAELKAAQASYAAARAALEDARRGAAAASDAIKPAKLASELERVAMELDAQSAAVATALAATAPRTPVASGGGSGETPGIATPSAGAGGPWRALEEDYIALRKRYHAANAKASLLRAAPALVVVPPGKAK